MGSTRLPGKVLADVGGEPLLAFLIRRLRPLPVTTVVVATSTLERDDAVAAVAQSEGVACIRGSESDVLNRFSQAVRAYPAESVVRVTADCPLLDPALVSAVLDLHRSSAADYTSNTVVRTFPDGLDVEVFRAAALIQAETDAVDPVEREHVTPFIYRRPGQFRLANLFSTELLGDERWTVDTAEDLELVRHIVTGLPSLQAGWRDILAMVGRRSELPHPARLVPEPRAAVWSTYEGIGEALDPASSRTWHVEWGGRPRGSLRVSVADGQGTLEIDPGAAPLTPDATAAAIGELQRILSASLQVMSLATHSPTAPVAIALEHAGFENTGSTWSWLRRN